MRKIFHNTTTNYEDKRDIARLNANIVIELYLKINMNVVKTCFIFKKFLMVLNYSINDMR